MSEDLQHYKTANAAMLAANRVRRQMNAPTEWDVHVIPVADLGQDYYIWEMSHATLARERISLNFYPSTKQYQAATLMDEEDYGHQEADKNPQRAVERLLKKRIEERQAQVDELKIELSKIRRKPERAKCTYCSPLGLKQGQCPRCGKRGKEPMIGTR